jgi:hypothetical protein
MHSRSKRRRMNPRCPRPDSRDECELALGEAVAAMQFATAIWCAAAWCCCCAPRGSRAACAARLCCPHSHAGDQCTRSERPSATTRRARRPDEARRARCRHSAAQVRAVRVTRSEPEVSGDGDAHQGQALLRSA